MNWKWDFSIWFSFPSPQGNEFCAQQQQRQQSLVPGGTSLALQQSMKKFLTTWKSRFLTENLNKDSQSRKDENPLVFLLKKWQSKHWHPVEACHLFSFLSTARRKERLAELKAWCRWEMLLLWAFLRAPGTVTTLLNKRKPTSDEKRVKGCCFFLHTQRQKCDCLSVYVKVKKPAQLSNPPSAQVIHSCSCKNVLFLLFLTKAYVCQACQCLLVASDVVHVMCNLISYRTRPSTPRAPNSISLCVEPESIIKNKFFHMIHFKLKLRLSINCGVF